jgi:patatin-related protein
MPDSSPQVDYTREVRFAVVMYGGVSLAIYINGVAQELLRLVRSTAVPAGSAPASGTERIYRKISYLLAEEDNGSAPAVSDPDDPQSFPPTRFLVDILSGTSAGGINGIFLAKALANGQDMEQLKDLWVREGDIESLINDKGSIEKPLSLQDPPTSLLNSERMYLELLKAFDGMDKAGGPRSETALSPYVDELDLFVTSTDLQGVVLPIRLSDDLVYERRHRNVLHFVYSAPDMSGEDEPRNDFLKKYNPFLAYAARCTSSFPFAFEPMCLCDTDELLAKLPGYRGDENCKSGSPEWQRFYRDYLDPRGVSTVPFPKRAFGDGGYLDNKPFSYATETLMNRNADVPVDRKLLYIEPSPEHPEDDVEHEQKADAISNVMSALNLPRYETIREDLQRVMDRNRLIDRVNRITAGVDRDTIAVRPQRNVAYGKPFDEWLDRGALASPPGPGWAREGLTDEEMSRLDLADMIKRKGRAYAAYHRLRIASLTDDLATLVARVGGFDEKSDYFIIVRSLVRAWRDRVYIEYRSEDKDAGPPMNRFLFDFDLSYPVRRVNYLRNKVDFLYRLDQKAVQFIADTVQAGERIQTARDDEKKIFRQELLRFKETLNDVFVSLRREGRSLRSRRSAQDKTGATTESPGSPVQEQVARLIAEIDRAVRKRVPDKDSPSAILDYFLGRRHPEASPGDQDSVSSQDAAVEDECTKRAIAFLKDSSEVQKLFNETAEALKADLQPVKKDAEERCVLLFSSRNTSPAPSDLPTGEFVQLAQRSIGHFYENYEDYDLITYPILYDTDVGEADTVEIIRVSPEDAKQLIDEREAGCHKLAGTALGHFGAFLEKLWRQNDILWGRLDGAERIIASLIPNHPQRAQLIGEAQAEIVCETILAMSEDERHELLAESLMRTRTRKAEPQLLDDFIEKLEKSSVNNPTLNDKLKQLIKKNEIRGFYVNNFSTRSHVEPESALRSVARATTVIGKMLADLSARRRVSSKYAAWIARLGQVFWALVEVAVPRSFPNLFFRHLLKLVYFLEALLIAGSTLLVAPDVQKFALTAFGLTAATHLAVVILGDVLESRNRWVNLGKAVGGVVLVLLIALGVVTLSGILGVNRSWEAIERAKTLVQQYTPFGQDSKRSVRTVFSVVFFLPFLWSIRGDLLRILRRE